MSKTQCPAVMTIREVSSDPPQNCRCCALPPSLGSKTTAACHGYWEIETCVPAHDSRLDRAFALSTGARRNEQRDHREGTEQGETGLLRMSSY